MSLIIGPASSSEDSGGYYHENAGPMSHKLEDLLTEEVGQFLTNIGFGVEVQYETFPEYNNRQKAFLTLYAGRPTDEHYAGEDWKFVRLTKRYTEKTPGSRGTPLPLPAFDIEVKNDTLFSYSAIKQEDVAQFAKEVLLASEVIHCISRIINGGSSARFETRMMGDLDMGPYGETSFMRGEIGPKGYPD